MPPRRAISPGAVTNSTIAKPCPTSRSTSASGSIGLADAHRHRLYGDRLGRRHKVRERLDARDDDAAKAFTETPKRIGALHERQAVGELIRVVRVVARRGKEEDALVRPENLLEVRTQVLGTLILGEDGDEYTVALLCPERPLEKIGEDECRKRPDGPFETEAFAG